MGWVVIRWWILISLDLQLWINLSQNKKIRSPRQVDEKGGVKARKRTRKAPKVGIRTESSTNTLPQLSTDSTQLDDTSERRTNIWRLLAIALLDDCLNFTRGQDRRRNRRVHD